MKKLLTAGVILLAATTLVGCGSKYKKETASKDYGLTNVTFPLKEEVSLNLLTTQNQVAPKNPNSKIP